MTIIIIGIAAAAAFHFFGAMGVVALGVLLLLKKKQ